MPISMMFLLDGATFLIAFVAFGIGRKHITVIRQQTTESKS